VVTVPKDPVAAFSVTDKLLFETVVAVPRADVPACPVGVTLASPSTSTDTEPNVPTSPATEAIA
jgi:hypothetical protein